jgi:hypothetical protein
MDPLLATTARPRVADWFARVKARPGYASAVEAWLAAPVVALMRKNGEEVWPDIAALLQAPPAAPATA